MEHLAKVVSEMDVRLRAVCTVDYGAAAAVGLHKIHGSIQSIQTVAERSHECRSSSSNTVIHRV